MAIPNPALEIISMDPFIIDGVLIFHLFTSNHDWWMVHI